MLIHNISGTLAELAIDEHGIHLQFKLDLGNSVVNSSTRYYTEDEVLLHWRIANKEELNNIT